MAREQRGVMPSPLVILSIVAVAMAAVAFVATRGEGPAERDITPAARVAPSAPATSGSPSASPRPSATPTRKPRPKPAVERSQVNVEVFNNSAIRGLAAGAATKVSDAGWKAVGADNWYGTIPATTVYYPARLERAARLLAKDLGVRRVMPAVDPMRMDRLTLILTAALPQR
ncbi:LytR C-terminal domain-containing protein [Nocardioides sp. TRM66260-LWL]|uniref:LytR C-terminal domain-containing protein n=1 Tax=Nocardioides sp. TRM66260-LWL TaxID=2874478 RepID=UPI001CC6FD11|nr:LytR C-terminal domain-containing protein [Nocardioides sp. TRM66260-LWL]MBZ5734592.1 LytR C-terminal domain-containing protein [Nocardioides sp. TRM66260-LWL]